MATVPSAYLEIHRGDNERLQAFVTPYTAAAQLFFMVKQRFGDPDSAALISKSIGNGITVVDPGGLDDPAEAQIVITRTDSQSAASQTHDTPLLYELTDGDDHTLIRGTLMIRPEVRLAG